VKKSKELLTLSQATKLSKEDLGIYIVNLKLNYPWHKDIKNLQVVYDQL